ncbi:hypothetical protein EGW08_020247 [Elysia chlorotica]|uniref:EF-hand domain-containing protein n=1 Tax=Elysia chlorotica TaxID=188477 RepID=A0A3S1AZ42_ELYCH|nr:hypothetical protein EGW08_020247 [Elysia chlorotica]
MPDKTNKSFEQKCEQFFKEANGGDPISVGQLAAVIRKACPSFQGSDQDIAQMFLEVDSDSDQKITWEEFTGALFAKDISEVTRAELEEAFKNLDKDKSGKLSREEVKNLMMELEISASEEALDKTISDVDSSGDGLIDIKEFLQLFKDANLA